MVVVVVVGKCYCAGRWAGAPPGLAYLEFTRFFTWKAVLLVSVVTHLYFYMSIPYKLYGSYYGRQASLMSGEMNGLSK